MEVQLGVDNVFGVNGVFLVSGGRTITVNSNISSRSPGGVSSSRRRNRRAWRNTFTGTTTVSGAGSTLSISADTNLGAVPGSATPGKILLSGGTLQATADFELNANRGITIGTGTAGSTGTIDVASGMTLTYKGVIANNGATSQLNKTGAGTLALGGVNTYSAGTLITDGTLRIDDVGALGTAGQVSLKPAGSNNGSLLLNVNAGSFGRPIFVGDLTDTGTGRAVLGSTTSTTGTVTFSATLTVRRAFTLQAGSSGDTRFPNQIVKSGTTPADMTISSPTANRQVTLTFNTGLNTFGNVTIGDAAGPHATLRLGAATASNNDLIPDSTSISFFASPVGPNLGSRLNLAPGSAATDGETVGH